MHPRATEARDESAAFLYVIIRFITWRRGPVQPDARMAIGWTRAALRASYSFWQLV
jgi:hypothetical protein